MELNDIQGLVIRGHGEMTAAGYAMLRITDTEKARMWLKAITTTITDGASKPDDFRLQIAFTYEGLTTLGIEQCYGLSVEFVQGMATEYRSRVLGDIEESSTKNWAWGGPDNAPVHITLMVYAKDASTLQQKLSELKSNWETSGIQTITTLDAPPNPYGKEHFGFRDGITQPIMPGLSKKGAPENTVAVGEFILGYRNGYDQLPDSPLLPKNLDPDNMLPPSEKHEEYKDFGKNGSYMVFRQLVQDVPAFWQQAKDAAQQLNEPESACVYAAAKMVGRWPNGKPLALAPKEETEFSGNEPYFLYKTTNDEKGFKCPVGAHIRRSNPRDMLPDNKPESSIKISNLHRILRRGRNFGPPLVNDFDVEKIKDTPDDGQLRGLHFICFNTNIARQFEFVQHMWCNNTKFAGFYNDPDPVLGIKDERNKNKTHEFTIEAEPVRKKIRGMKRHVTVRGGAYFFMPGLRTLKYLSQLKTTNP